VRVEGEQATAAARAAERRKRRRLAARAAAALAVAALGGLGAVLAVQRRANADLATKNAALAREQAKVEARNKELADEQAKVQQRFELAQKAIALFHTGVSEDMLLKNAEFKELRTRLLKEAAGFYADLDKLLAGQTDFRSRQALAAAYFRSASSQTRSATRRRLWRSTSKLWHCGESWRRQRERMWKHGWTWPGTSRRWGSCWVRRAKTQGRWRRFRSSGSWRSGWRRNTRQTRSGRWWPRATTASGPRII
jgi:hypothetical protein